MSNIHERFEKRKVGDINSQQSFDGQERWSKIQKDSNHPLHRLVKAWDVDGSGARLFAKGHVKMIEEHFGFASWRYISEYWILDAFKTGLIQLIDGKFFYKEPTMPKKKAVKKTPVKAIKKPTVFSIVETTVDDKGGRLMLKTDDDQTMILSMDIEQLEQLAEAATALAELLTND